MSQNGEEPSNFVTFLPMICATDSIEEVLNIPVQSTDGFVYDRCPSSASQTEIAATTAGAPFTDVDWF